MIRTQNDIRKSKKANFINAKQTNRQVIAGRVRQIVTDREVAKSMRERRALRGEYRKLRSERLKEAIRTGAGLPSLCLEISEPPQEQLEKEQLAKRRKHQEARIERLPFAKAFILKWRRRYKPT